MNTSHRRALIVIDVQNENVTGKLRIQYPAIDSSLANIGRAMDAARNAGIPVIVVQNYAPESSPLFARGSHGWKLHSVVETRPRDHHVDKTLPSTFTEADLGDWSRRHEIDTLTVVGYMTHNCDASTIVHAMHEGLKAELLDDASGSVPYRNEAGAVSGEDIHRVYSVVLHSRFAAVVSADSWIEAVQAGKPFARSSIYASNQAALNAQLTAMS